MQKIKHFFSDRLSFKPINSAISEDWTTKMRLQSICIVRMDDTFNLLKSLVVFSIFLLMISKLSAKLMNLCAAVLSIRWIKRTGRYCWRSWYRPITVSRHCQTYISTINASIIFVEDCSRKKTSSDNRLVALTLRPNRTILAWAIEAGLNVSDPHPVSQQSVYRRLGQHWLYAWHTTIYFLLPQFLGVGVNNAAERT